MNVTFVMAIILADVVLCIEFPFNEFFNYANMSDAEADEMKRTFLCSANTTKWNRRCHCDENCMKYHTCCIDYLWKFDETQSLETYIQRFVSEAKQHKHVTCSPLVSGLPSTHTTDSVLMISKCPKRSNKALKSNCRRNTLGMLNLPVIGTDRYVYKNKFCAICHGVGAFEKVEVTAHCESLNMNRRKNSTNILKNYSKCNFAASKNSTRQAKYIKKCNVVVQSKCKLAKGRHRRKMYGLSECRLCRYYIAGITPPGEVTCCRNSHCCSLNDATQTDNRIFQKPKICLNVLGGATSKILYEIFLPRYSILVSYKNDLRSFDNPDEPCISTEVYDTESRKCITDAHCGFGYRRQGSTCVNLPAVGTDLVASDDTTDHLHSHSDDDPFVKSDNDDSKKRYIEHCSENHVYISIRVNGSAANNTVKQWIAASVSDSTFKVLHENSTHLILKGPQLEYVNFSNRLSNLQYEIIKTSVPDVYANYLYGVDFFRIFNKHRVCASPIIHDYDKFDISSNCFVFLNQSVLYTNDYVIVTILGSQTQHILVTCKRFHLFKPCLIRSIASYSIYPNNSVLSTENILYNVEEYAPTENKALSVCIKTSHRKHVWLVIVNAVNGYLTVIGCAASIIAYICIILTYGMIRELRTIPGKNIVCLCFMLMICDALMLVSTAVISCKYVAIFLHFFALAAQFWSVVIAFDIWSTFQGKTLSRNMKSTKRFIFYCLFAWLCPLGLVLLSIILDQTKMAAVGYGGNGICWITNLAARITTYIAPVGVMILFTVVTLSYTLYGIYKQCRKSKALLKRRGGDNVKFAQMATKLVTLLGVIEILGFIQFQGVDEINWIVDSIFQLFYTIARSFRGVFIWLLYVVTDRVFAIYRGFSSRRTYRQATQLSKFSVSQHSRTFSTRSSDNFNTTLTISPTPV